MEIQLTPKQERQLRAARALAKVRSRQTADKVYINKTADDYLVTDCKNSTSILCYKNGNEIAL